MDASKIPNSLEKPDVFASEATKRGAVWTKAVIGLLLLLILIMIKQILKPFLMLRMGL